MDSGAMQYQNCIVKVTGKATGQQCMTLLIIAYLIAGKNSVSKKIKYYSIRLGPVDDGFVQQLSKITFSKSSENIKNVTSFSNGSTVERSPTETRPCREKRTVDRDNERASYENWENCRERPNGNGRNKRNGFAEGVTTVEKMLSTCENSRPVSDFRRIVILGERANIQPNLTFEKAPGRLDLGVLEGSLTALEKILNVINNNLSRTRCQFIIVVLISNESWFQDLLSSEEEKFAPIYNKIEGESMVYFVLLGKEKVLYTDRNTEMPKDKHAESDFIKLFELQGINKNPSLRKFPITPCRNLEENLEKVLEEISLEPTHYNLQGEMIRPILYTDGSPVLNAVIKRSLKLVSAMSLTLNFTIKPIYGDGWISIGPNGSLLGVARLLEASTGDLLSQTHELTIEHGERLDFVFPTVTHREEAFFRQPSRVFDSIMFRPFSTELLVALTIVSLALFLMMSMILNFKHCNFSATMDQHAPSSANSTWGFPYINISAIGDSVMWVLGLFTQQGWLEYPGIASLRVVSVSGLCVSLVSNMLYSASILSTIKSREVPIRSFKGLLGSGIDIFIDREAHNAVGIMEEVLRTSNETVIGKRLLRVEDGILRMLHNASAFLSYRIYIENAAEYMGKHVFENYCDFVSSVLPNPRGLQVYNGMFVKKHSPLRKLFRYS
ncbi:unnamed protein product [Orchesella dallaii]|uniref:Uncharacterized protein n=1 Tax=Orchesella dallaii TaxID=48710 RepID=A0ABP1QIC1_9HEXA